MTGVHDTVESDSPVLDVSLGPLEWMRSQNYLLFHLCVFGVLVCGGFSVCEGGGWGGGEAHFEVHMNKLVFLFPFLFLCER